MTWAAHVEGKQLDVPVRVHVPLLHVYEAEPFVLPLAVTERMVPATPAERLAEHCTAAVAPVQLTFAPLQGFGDAVPAVLGTQAGIGVFTDHS